MWRRALGLLSRRAVPAGAAALVTGVASWSASSAASEPVVAPTHAVDAAHAGNATLGRLLTRVLALEKAWKGEAHAPAYVVVSPTFYPSLTDVRLHLGLDACRRAKALGVPLLRECAADANPRCHPSPRASSVRVQPTERGARTRSNPTHPRSRRRLAARRARGSAGGGGGGA